MSNQELSPETTQELEKVLQDSVDHLNKKSQRDILTILCVGQDAIQFIQSDVNQTVESLLEWAEIINDSCDLANESFDQSIALVKSGNDFDKFWFWETINLLHDGMRHLEIVTTKLQHYLRFYHLESLAHLQKARPDIESWLQHQQDYERLLQQFSE